MNCPKCNNEMTLGFIQSPRGIIWGTRIHKLTFLPEEGEVWVKNANIFGAYKETFRCPECGTIVILDQD